MTAQKTESLRAAFLAELPHIVTAVEDAWNRMLAGERGRDALFQIHARLEGLDQAAAALGYAALSDAARLLHVYVGALAAEDEDIKNPEERQIEVLLTGLFGEVARLAPAPAVSLPGPSEPEDEDAALDRRRVFLLQDDPTQRLAVHLGHRGFVTHVFANVGDLRAALARGRPTAVVLDLALPDGTLIEAETADDLRRAGMRSPALLFVSARADLAARLHAARLHATAFLPKPLDIEALLDELERLALERTEGPLRGVVTGFDVGHARARVRALQVAGMIAETVEDPGLLMARLQENRPEIVVVEAGDRIDEAVDLAGAVRHEVAWQGLPIVLVADATAEARTRARRVGVEVCLPRACGEDELSDVAVAAARRYRHLRSQGARDPLTGLYGNRAIVDRLDVELARADRELEPVSFVSLQIEGLRRINEAHGHLAGDRVLVRLARHLSDRLRATDVVGRYGAGRFALVLPNTVGPSALALVDGLRKSFARQKHLGRSGDFTASFDAGLSSYPHHSDAATLRDAADRALREARAESKGVVLRGARGARGRRILVVDDDHDLTRLLEMALEQHGYEVILAHDGLRALEVAEREHPDLVLSDLLLPYLSGFELCRRLKERATLESVPVIAMTGVYRKHKYRVEAHKAGAVDLIEKPFDLAAMLATVDRCLEPVADAKA